MAKTILILGGSLAGVGVAHTYAPHLPTPTP